MPDMTQYVAAIGPLDNPSLVIVGVAFTAGAWLFGAEVLLIIFATFEKQSAYSISLYVASLGVLCFQSSVFSMIFAPWSNGYGIIVGVDIGWTCMVTGQSMVLWSRLHLVCRKRWLLQAVLAMIITNCILLHGTQTGCSLLAVQNNAINPEYPPFVYTEKVSVCIFFAQEVFISSIYLTEALKFFRTGHVLHGGGNYRRMRNLFLANIAIVALDICLIALEFSALWGVWCTFKGFAYSVKLKIELAILNQLRDSILPRSRNGKLGGPDRQTTSTGGTVGLQAGPCSHIRKTTEYTVHFGGKTDRGVQEVVQLAEPRPSRSPSPRWPARTVAGGLIEHGMGTPVGMDINNVAGDRLQKVERDVRAPWTAR